MKGTDNMSMNNETSSSPKKRKKAAETTEDIIKDLMTKLGGVFKKDIYIIQGRTVFPGNISYDMLNGSFICILEDKYQKAISEFIKDGVEMYYVDNITEAKTNFAEHFTPVSNVDEMEHVIHKLRAVRSYMNTIEEWCSFKDFLDDNGVGPSDNWVGLQFVGDSEEPITIDADGTKGKYRETGQVLIHVVAPVGFGIVPAIMARAETLRNLLRGRRIGDIIIESVTPANFGFGAALQFEGGYTAATFICGYERDFDL